MAQINLTRAYDDYSVATRVVAELEQAGIPHADISLVGRDTAGNGAGHGDNAAVTGDHAEGAEKGAGTGASIGTIIGGGAGLLAGLGSLAIPGVGPVVAAGWLVATLTGAGVGAAVGGGTGGLVGLLTGAGVPEEHAHVYAETVRRGGNLVTVRADELQAPAVEAILDRATPINPTLRRSEYEQAGWTRHDDTVELEGPNPSVTPSNRTGVL